MGAVVQRQGGDAAGAGLFHEDRQAGAEGQRGEAAAGLNAHQGGGDVLRDRDGLGVHSAGADAAGDHDEAEQAVRAAAVPFPGQDGVGDGADMGLAQAEAGEGFGDEGAQGFEGEMGRVVHRAWSPHAHGLRRRRAVPAAWRLLSMLRGGCTGEGGGLFPARRCGRMPRTRRRRAMPEGMLRGE
jgi:hypothetical protein